MKNRAILLCLALASPLAGAAGPPVPDNNDSSTLDFALRFARFKTPLDYVNRASDTTTRWIGVSLREKASPRITLGMYGGYAYLTQTGNPLTAGLELDGYHAGLSLHAILWSGRRGSLYGAVDYAYQKTDHEGATQTVVIDWVQARARIGAALAPAEKWRLYGGGNYGKIEGEERASGAVNHTLDVVRDARAGGFLGLDLNVETDGYVGVEARSGVERGVEIYFKRKF